MRRRGGDRTRQSPARTQPRAPRFWAPSASGQWPAGSRDQGPPKAALCGLRRGPTRRHPGAGPRFGGDSRQHPLVSTEDSGLLRCRPRWSWLTVTPQFVYTPTQAHIGVHTQARAPGLWVRLQPARHPGTVPALEEAPPHLRCYETMSRAPPPASRAPAGSRPNGRGVRRLDCRHPQSPIHMSLVKQELLLFLLDPHPLQLLNCPQRPF